MRNTFKTKVQVRFRDLDMMGHVNHAVFFSYFEAGRTDFHFSNVSNKLGRSSSSFIIARASCDFIKPITLSTKVFVELYVKRIGQRSFDYGYILSDLEDESIEYARGESVQVCFDYSKDESIEVSSELKEILGKYRLADPEPALSIQD